MRTLLCSAFALALMAPVLGRASTDTPPNDDRTVVEVLRERPLSQEERAWRTVRARLRAEPTRADLASQVAQQALQWARRDGDPRWIGQARAALAPWWHEPTPAPDIRLLRAIVNQSTHRFDAALADLDAVTRARPGHAQAWLSLASVQMVTGRYQATARSCHALEAAGAPWHRQVCEHELASFQGDADGADAALSALAARAPAALQPWLTLVRAELAERRGQARVAGALYARLLADAPDAYTEAAYADWLLDQQHHEEVITRLRPLQRNDALLLRLAEAYAATGHPGRDAAVQTLQARFAAARLRGDGSVHLREEARFQLRLLRRPQQALTLALANWAVQKEPADARLLLEAAEAAGQAQAAEPARRFIREAGWADQRLARWM